MMRIIFVNWTYPDYASKFYDFDAHLYYFTVIVIEKNVR